MIDIENLLNQIHAAIHVMDEKSLPNKGRELYLPHHFRHEIIQHIVKKRQEDSENHIIIPYFEGAYIITGKKPTLFGIPIRFYPIRFYTEGERLPELDLFGIKAPCLFWKGESTNYYEGDHFNRIAIPYFSLPLRLIEMERK